ncbi:MAG: Rieske 2Fe-2S domain-containing protein [Cyanobacteria bacterium CRU_2_1]|nr:Rieske 2Fe-2S domain-containing protein [Cyanobacteria bacterium RU_5_0]NJR61063.1 Rieske 2Fe-2S domain-containing protein [Cyanobacteria bacterium CRU_2_1]
MAGWVKVAAVSDLASGTMQVVEVNGLQLLLVNVVGEIFVLNPRCPHRSAPLIEGQLRGIEIECPWHHYRYDVRTGENLYPRNVYPADLSYLQRDLQPLQCYPIWLKGDEIFVEFSGD